MRLSAEQEMDVLIRDEGLPVPDREHRFLEHRRFRFDFAWPDRAVALEVEGGTTPHYRTIRGRRVKVFAGRHNRPKGYEDDCTKYSEAAIRGWKVIRVTPQMVRDGRALDFLKRVLEA